MKIALLGGNSYEYAFAPSYAQANGTGVINQHDLLGSVDDPGEQPVDRRTRAYNIATDLIDLGKKGLETFTDKSSPASTSDMGQQATDNTALIITGAVAGVAVLAVMLGGKGKRGRK